MESDDLRSIWRQMLLATLPAKYVRFIHTDVHLDNEILPDGQARYVPNGLRVVEALLLQCFAPSDIAVCYPDRLFPFIGVVVNPEVVEELSPWTVNMSATRHPALTHPDHRYTMLFVGLETGSRRLFDQYMKGKCYPYRSEQWPDVVMKGMEILNCHNWFPVAATWRCPDPACGIEVRTAATNVGVPIKRFLFDGVTTGAASKSGAVAPLFIVPVEACTGVAPAQTPVSRFQQQSTAAISGAEGDRDPLPPAAHCDSMSPNPR